MKNVYRYICVGLMVVGLIGCGKSPSSSTDTASSGNYTQQAQAALDKGDFLAARDLYKKEMEQASDPAKLDQIRAALESLNMKIVMSTIVDECSTTYIVQPKDSLYKIARKFDTTPELIMKANSMTTEIIVPDQKLKVNTCPFSIAVDKSQNLLFLKRKGEVIKTYVVSTGKNNCSPIGTFKIVNKIVNPTWYKTGAAIPADSPENILGTRWMGFDLKSFGIHGTTEPEKLGTQATAGCVRMRNDEVEELYDLIPVGAEVTIVD